MAVSAVVRLTPAERQAVGRIVADVFRAVIHMGPVWATAVIGGGCAVAVAYITFPTWWDRIIDWWDR